MQPRITKNAELEVAGRTEQKDMLEKQTLRLASSIAITVLCVRHKIFLEGNDLKDLFRGLVLHFDLEKKKCPEFESLSCHFPQDSWL